MAVCFRASSSHKQLEPRGTLAEKYLRGCASSGLGECSNTADALEPAGGGHFKNRAVERGKKMVIVTSIYCAKLERVQDAFTHQQIEPSIADLKDAERDLMSVYQGTNRTQPMDGER
ncbi:hypothetical protein P8935_19880 [Telmatobacter sp. DSM 110680]|uniref:Uncharacterized protein n=1 Tax=Telmatobacter sp. DSM 110680 TaxID=3036704 RepID=A0AAU7DGK0_9BACT